MCNQYLGKLTDYSGFFSKFVSTFSTKHMSKKILSALIALSFGASALAQGPTTTQGIITDPDGAAWKVTQEIQTKARRTTSQGVPGATLDYTQEVMSGDWAIPLVHSYMTRYPDPRKAYWAEYSYVHGYVMDAILRLYLSSGEKSYLDYVKTYIDHFVDADGTYHGARLNSLDNIMTGSVISRLYGITREGKYASAARHIMEAVDSYPASDGQFWHSTRYADMWIDGVFMGQMFLLRYAQYIGDKEKCLDIACRNIIAAANHLQRADGLMYHAWSARNPYPSWADPKTGLASQVWSEGLGWYALIIVELLEALPSNHPQRAQVEEIYRKLAGGLLATQDGRTGGWFMVVDRGEFPLNFIDPSGTAMFLYSIQKGLDLGLLPRKKYQDSPKKAYDCLASFIQVNGNGLLDILGGCDGVGVQDGFLDYLVIPKITNAKETVGGAIWAALLKEGKI